MTRKLFITGTDTGSGKSYVASRLIRMLKETGISSIALKPVACGSEGGGINEDVAGLLEAQHLNDPDQINLYSFARAASPNIAAAAEGRAIDPAELLRWCEERSSGFELCLIEGVGGVMVPLNGRYLVRDWIAGLNNCDVVLVIGAKLGAINHALLSLDQLIRSGVAPRHIITNALDPDYVSDVEESIAPFLPDDCTLQRFCRDGEAAELDTLLDMLLAK